MARGAPLHAYTFAEYLDLEEASTVRHEFLDGEIYAMAGGTPEHAALAAAITAALAEQVRGTSGRVYSSGLRVRVLETGLATYPDVTVVCGPSERDPDSPTHATNPSLVVEVLSDATRDDDRGEKLEHYKRIPSLRAVLLFEPTVRDVALLSHAPDGTWRSERLGPQATVDLAPGAAAVRLDLDAIYDAAAE